MPIFIVHLTITLFVLAAFMSYIDRKNFKYLPVLILFGVIPDLDVFIGLHRATFHNIFFAVAPFLVWFGIWVIYKKLKLKGIKKIEKKQIFFCLASGFLILHIILDIFCGGVFVFYPAHQENIDFSSSLVLTQKEIMPSESKNITDIPQNVTQTPKNVTSPPLAPNITTPILTPAPTPSPTPKPHYTVKIDIERNKPKNISEASGYTNYTVIPSKDHSKPIINNGVELIFLITSIMMCIIKYFEPNFKKLKGN